MGENSGSKDKSLEALDFIINVLKEHEQNLDESIDKLTTVTENIGDTSLLTGKLEKVEEKINNLQTEVTKLICYLSNAPKAAFPTPAKEEQPKTQAAPAVSPAVVQAGPYTILRCKQWEDFQVLAMHAQTLAFSFKEDEKVFEADVIKGNQMITYTGILPNFSLILKTWLSRQFEVTEQNILEGFLDKPK